MTDCKFEPLIERKSTYDRWVFRDEDGEVVTVDVTEPSDRIKQTAEKYGITCKRETFTYWYKSID